MSSTVISTLLAKLSCSSQGCSSGRNHIGARCFMKIHRHIEKVELVPPQRMGCTQLATETGVPAQDVGAVMGIGPVTTAAMGKLQSKAMSSMGSPEPGHGTDLCKAWLNYSLCSCNYSFCPAVLPPPPPPPAPLSSPFKMQPATPTGY